MKRTHVLVDGVFTYVDNQRQGEARQTSPDGSVVYYTYRDDKRQGKARQTDPDGTTTDFTCVDDVPQGIARLTKPDGTVWDLNFVDGVPQGKARETYPDGNIIDFTYVDDERQGKARMTFVDGRVLDFTYVDGERDGEARMTFPNGKMGYFTYVDGKRESSALHTLVLPPPSDDESEDQDIRSYKSKLPDFHRRILKHGSKDEVQVLAQMRLREIDAPNADRKSDLSEPSSKKKKFELVCSDHDTTHDGKPLRIDRWRRLKDRRHFYKGNCPICGKWKKKLRICTCLWCKRELAFAKKDRTFVPTESLYCGEACQAEYWPYHRREHHRLVDYMSITSV